MKLRNLILASGLTALATACYNAKISYDAITIEDETYICKQSIQAAGNSEVSRWIKLVNKQGKELSHYNGSSMELYGPTSPLTYRQAAELTEECIRKFSAAEKETK